MIFKNIFLSKSSRTHIQMFRYSLSGVLAFAIDFLSLLALTELFSLHYLLSAAFAFLIGSVCSYSLNTYWVFDERRLKNKHAEFWIFIVLNVVALVLNELLIWFFTEKIHSHYLTSKIISTIILTPLNFYIRKYILYKKSKNQA